MEETSLHKIGAHVLIAIPTHDDVPCGVPEVRFVNGLPCFDVRMQPNDLLTLLQEVDEHIKDFHRVHDIPALQRILGLFNLLSCPNTVTVRVQFVPPAG
jgi:hypothetical protein